jgi:hypothetical protein
MVVDGVEKFAEGGADPAEAIEIEQRMDSACALATFIGLRSPTGEGYSSGLGCTFFLD